MLALMLQVSMELPNNPKVLPYLAKLNVGVSPISFSKSLGPVPKVFSWFLVVAESIVTIEIYLLSYHITHLYHML